MRHSRFGSRFGAPHIIVLLLIAAVLMIAAAWRWTPLSAYTEPAQIAGWFSGLRHEAIAPFVVVGAYLLAAALMFPNTVLNAAVILGLGTSLGLPCALGGSLTAALVFYALGRRYGERRLRKVSGERVQRLRRMLQNSGPLRVATIRLLPVAPFSVVNVVAGAAKVRPLPYATGTVLGLLPGNLLMTAFGHQLRSALREPSIHDTLLLAGIVVVALIGGWWLHRLAARR